VVEITEGPIDFEAVTERVRSDLAGAVCLFLGTVREMTGDRRTSSLDYEAYPGMAQKKMEELEAEARRRWPVIEAAIVHRVGHLELGEISVAVAVSTPHRRHSFEACRWMIDTLKEVVPIWKKEVWADGTEEWVHPGMGGDSPSSPEKSATASELG
jgi:molybdopterin synthase catalytic subunit